MTVVVPIISGNRETRFYGKTILSRYNRRRYARYLFSSRFKRSFLNLERLFTGCALRFISNSLLGRHFTKKKCKILNRLKKTNIYNRRSPIIIADKVDKYFERLTLH